MFIGISGYRGFIILIGLIGFIGFMGPIMFRHSGLGFEV